jgi:OmpA-OmpF porin, OOP family
MKKKIALFSVILSALFVADRGLCQIPALTSFQAYDFVPGTTVVFEDAFTNDAVGKLPGHWMLKRGQGVADIKGNDKAFFLTGDAIVSPLMKNSTYLTKSFSIEYDFLPHNDGGTAAIRLDDANNSGNMQIRLSKDAGASWTGYASVGDKESPGFFAALPADIGGKNFDDKWHHIIIAYENDQMKIYLDKYRVLMVPHCNGLPPASVLIYAGNTSDGRPLIIKNFKIVDGSRFYLAGQTQN